jgi:hypothetical protein
MKNRQTKVQAGIAIWRDALGQKQESLVPTLKNRNPKLSISKSHLSKAKTGNEPISPGTLLQLEKALDALLAEYGYSYDTAASSYVLIDEQKKQANLPDATAPKQPLESIAGIYESYHLSKHGVNILKNIIHLYPNGRVEMWGIDDNRYYGEAHIFQSSLLSICFHRANDYPFFIQIICHIGNYGKLASREIKHFFGVCSSVSIDNEPIAY